MAASVTFDEFNGAGSTRTASITNINFGTNDSANLVVATYPITAGSNSYEKFIKANFGGTFNYVGSVQFWWSGTTCTYKTAEVLYCTDSGTAEPTYATPVMTNSTICTGTICSGAGPPTKINVALMGEINGANGSLASAGSSDYIVLQLRTGATTEPGAVNQKTLKLQWVEA